MQNAKKCKKTLTGFNIFANLIQPFGLRRLIRIKTPYIDNFFHISSLNNPNDITFSDPRDRLKIREKTFTA